MPTDFDQRLVQQPPDRRRHPRYEHPELAANIRRRGVPWSQQGDALDFNRYGISVHMPKAVSEGTEFYLTLSVPGSKVPELKASVHSCRPWRGGFRVGLQFRPEAGSAYERATLLAGLLRLELRLAHEQGERALLGADPDGADDARQAEDPNTFNNTLDRRGQALRSA